MLLFYNSNSAKGQSEWSCQVENNNTFLSSTPDDAIPPCTTETALYTTDEFTFDKTIKINIHYVQKSLVEPFNFTETDDGNGNTDVNGGDMAQQIVDYCNNMSNSNSQMNMLPGNSTQILDRKYHFVLNEVYYWQDEIQYLFNNTSFGYINNW